MFVASTQRRLAVSLSFRFGSMISKAAVVFAATLSSLLLLAAEWPVPVWAAQQGSSAQQQPTTQPQSESGQPPVPPLYRRDPASTITVTARTVLLDVMAVDSKGNPIRGLKQSDFQIQEDGAAQTVNSFHEHTSADPSIAAAEIQQIKLPTNAFTNFVPFHEGSTLTVILLDAFNMPVGEQMRIRSGLIAYMKTVPPGRPIAIFQMDSTMHLIQGFTADPEVLREAVEGKRDNLRMPSPYLQRKDFVVTQSRLDVFRAGLAGISSYLAGYSGRKNLIWFTANVPGSGMGMSSQLPELEDYTQQLNSASETLALNRVSIYPVDVRGLETDPAWSVSHPGPPPMTGSTFYRTRFEDHSAMERMASETGGHAFYNTNGLRQVIERVINTGSSYYTLAYTPTNKDWNGSYRKIRVELTSTMPGIQLQYRQGYKARPPSATQTRRVLLSKQAKLPDGQMSWTRPAAAKPNVNEAFVKAMQLGAIPPTQVLFNASFAPGTQTQKLDKNAPLPVGDTMRGDLRGKPFRQYHVLYLVSPKSFLLSPASDGSHQGQLEFVTLLYNDQGEQLNSAINRLPLDLTPETYATIMTGGLELRQDIAIPTQGVYFLRLGVHDVSGNRVGAMEIPVDDIHLKVAGPGQTLTP